jgi:hypothetical protein
MAAEHVNLTWLANHHKTDKGSLIGNKHYYTRFYSFLLEQFREQEFSMLEVGLLIGGPELGFAADRPAPYIPSIRTWLDYFPNVHCYGIDISDFSHLQGPRFTFFQADLSRAEEVSAAAAQLPALKLIVDDASHASFHQQMAFYHFFPLIEPGGFYVIEDLNWQPGHLESILPSCRKTGEIFSDFTRNGEFSLAVGDEAVVQRLARDIHKVFIHRADSEDAQPGPIKLIAVEKKAATMHNDDTADCRSVNSSGASGAAPNPRIPDAMTDRLIDRRHIVAADEGLFRQIMARNREALRQVSSWIPAPRSVEHAGYGGGCNPDLEVDTVTDEITYTDLMAFLMNYLERPPSYLEIGVSLGKNFFQLYNAGPAGSYFCALDAEEANPRLEALLPPRIQEIEIGPRFRFMHLSKTQRALKYAPRSPDKSVEYIVGDLREAAAWRYLTGRKFNMIFSDACHDAASINHEFDMIESNNLLDRHEFIGMWDDMGDPGMRAAFTERMLRWSSQGKLPHSNFHVLWCYGSYGRARVVGLAYNLNGFVLRRG